MSLEELSAEVQRWEQTRRPAADRGRSAADGLIAGWFVSAAVHGAVVFAAAILLVFHRLDDRSPEIQYAAGNQVVPNVRLLSEEEVRQLYRPRHRSGKSIQPIGDATTQVTDAVLPNPTPVREPMPPQEVPTVFPRNQTVAPAEPSPPLVDSVPQAEPALSESDLAKQLTDSQPDGSAAGQETARSIPTAPEGTGRADAFDEASSEPLATASPALIGITTGAMIQERSVPRYPALSIRNREEGLVLLRVEVRADGSVGDIEVLRNPGHKRLVDAAIEAARKARFTPAIRGGQRVASTVDVPYRFVLRDHP